MAYRGWGVCSSRTADGRIPVESGLGAPRPRASCYTLGRKFWGIREGLRCRNRRTARGPAAVSDLTDLSAGGLRSSATVGTAHRPKGEGARRMGADPCDGLAAAERGHPRTNPGWPCAPILGSEARRILGIEGRRESNCTSAEAGLLRSKRFLLGRSDSVSCRRTLERCPYFCVLEWSSCEGHSLA